MKKNIKSQPLNQERKGKAGPTDVTLRIAERLAETIRLSKHPLNRIAAAAGCSTSTIRRIRDEGAVPTVDVLNRVSKLEKMEPADFFEGLDIPGCDDETREFLFRVRKLARKVPRRLRGVVLKFLDSLTTEQE